jgi:Histidine kinase-, DNA gyrase B-, and HSP90-like ATPase
VFSNLLSNAAKYTDPGGRITLSLAVDESFANITVSDTGRGIDPAAIATIFTLFARAASDCAGSASAWPRRAAWPNCTAARSRRGATASDAVHSSASRCRLLSGCNRSYCLYGFFAAARI